MARRWLIGCGAVAAAVLLVGALGVAALILRAEPGSAPPRGAAVSAELEPDLSVLVIPVRIPIQAIQRSVDASVPDVLVEEEGKELEGGLARMDLKVARAGEIQVRAEGEQLRVTVPIDVTAKVYAGGRADRRKGKGKDTPEGVTARASIAMDLRLDLALSEEWRLTPEVNVSHRWLSTPTVSLGPLKIGVEKLAERQLADAERELGPKIAKRMAEKSDTRERVEEAWAALHAPAQVSTDPPAWWVSEPARLMASNPAIDGDDVVVRVGVEARFALVVGATPPAAVKAPALPKRVAPKGAARFAISTPVLLAWEPLGGLASPKVVGQSWSVGGATVTATGIELYPSGDRAVVALTWTSQHAGWDADGTLYLAGRPELEERGKTLRIVDVEAVVDTWDSSISTPAALAQSALEEELAARLVFPIGEQLEAARAQAEDALQGRRKGVNVSGEVSAVELRGVRVTDEGLLVDTRVTGSASLESRLFKTPSPQALTPAPAPR